MNGDPENQQSVAQLRLRRKLPTTPEAVRTEMARRHLLAFAEQSWAIVEPMIPFVGGWWFRAMCEHLEAVTVGKIQRLLISLPPRMTKSTLVGVLWPAWTWIHRPELRWIFSSYVEDLPQRDARRCRLLLESEWYRSRWGSRFRLLGMAEDAYTTNHGGERISTSVGGSITGKGGDVVVVDDPHNVRDVENESALEKACWWWDNVMSTRLNHPLAGARVIVGQRVHERDLSGHVLQQGGYEHLCIPGEYDPAAIQIPTSLGWTDPRSEDGELICPERFPREVYDDYRLRLGTDGFAAQINQRPRDLEGAMIRRTWWRFYDEEPPSFDRVIISVDAAFNDAATSSFVVIQTWGQLGPNFYALRQVREHLDFPATIHEIQNERSARKDIRAIVIEAKANGHAAAATLKQRISGIVLFEPRGSKASRLAAVSPLIEGGNVYLPRPGKAPWVTDFISELCTFPKSPKNDQVDGCTQALLYLSGRQRQRTPVRLDSFDRESMLTALGD